MGVRGRPPLTDLGYRDVDKLFTNYISSLQNLFYK